MITISKTEAKMLRKMFPKVHMTTTVHKTMVDEVSYVLKALPNNVEAQKSLQEMERDAKRAGIYNSRNEV